ncbi:DUF6880 family protein [Methylocaldum sp.]|uniref:SWIM zinc finger family protein n=1 Tax=Methylocaldum sp. TaxID=1969727 RepID=UPI0032203C23
MSELARLVTEKSLRRHAGATVFDRGAGYFRAGAVVDLADTGAAVKARVMGSEEYRVTLRADRGALDYACTCPMGEDGDFCKHVVATGLAWLAQHEDGKNATPFSATPEDFDALREYLNREDKPALVALILAQAEEDPDFRNRMRVKAAREIAPGNLKALKDTVRKAMTVHGFVDYYGVRGYLAQAAPVSELLSGLLKDRRADETVQLAEYAIALGFDAYENVDDSDGGLGQLLEEIGALHLKACKAARPDGEALAKRLFDLQLRDDWGFFRFEDYAPLLGKSGMDHYRKLAEAAWSKVPARKPGDREPWDEERRFTLTAIMETLARRDGDFDRLIEIKSRNLTSPHSFFEIAELLAKARRHEEALEWAERGHQAFRGEPHEPLVEFLIAAYHRAKRHEDALTLAWDQFRRWPSLAAYQRLKRSAGRAKTWPQWRDKALAQVRAASKDTGQKRGRWGWSSTGNSLLVEIFLWEGDPDTALAEAKAGGCAEDLWLRLAEALEKDRPEESIAIYQARVEPVVERKNNQAYDQAAALIEKIGGLMKRTGKKREFAAWTEALRTKHKAKRNFMARLIKLRTNG